MMAPAGHVTVVVVKADVPEPHTVEYSWPGEAVTDGLAGREADLLRDALTDGDTAPPRREALTEGDAPPSNALAEREREGLEDRDGLADALTSLHCT